MSSKYQIRQTHETELNSSSPSEELGPYYLDYKTNAQTDEQGTLILLRFVHVYFIRGLFFILKYDVASFDRLQNNSFNHTNGSEIKPIYKAL